MRQIRLWGIIVVVFSALLWADSNATVPPASTMSEADQKRLTELRGELKATEESEERGTIWTKVYSNYLTYKNLKSQEVELGKAVRKLAKLKYPNDKQKEQLKRATIELKTIEGKLALMKEFRDDPFKHILEPPTIEEAPSIGNPFNILSALSFKKKLTDQQAEYEATYLLLVDETKKLRAKKILLKQILKLQYDVVLYEKKLADVAREIDTFAPVLEIFKTTKKVYSKKVEETKLKLDIDVQLEYEKMLKILAITIVFLVLFFFAKYLLRRYMSDRDSYYMANKAVNFAFLTLLILVLLFAYIENVSHMATVIGFASAGIAIALKDWFMSLMGWWVIVFGGSISVGNRVLFVRGNVQYVGDIVDISLLRMTMQEDVTLTSYMENRRTGRIIFIPNHYIFTDMIANYSHAGLKTVWDGIDVTVTFDSNIDRAIAIAREVTTKYSKGYTDITRKQLNNLRSQYHIKNTNVTPRIHSLIEPHGMVISSWYLTNSFATLTLRSTISLEIIQRIQKADDIEIAYPTQSLYMNSAIPKPNFPDTEGMCEQPKKSETSL